MISYLRATHPAVFMFSMDPFALRMAEMNKVFFRLFPISRSFPHTHKHILGRLIKTKTPILFITVIISFILLPFQPALAGAPPLQWQKTFGGSIWEEGYLVKQTSDGGYIIAGRTEWYYGDRPWERSSDVYLIKTDPNGNTKWQRTFGGTDEEWGYSVQQTSDGGYIITGGTSSFDAVLRDVYLVKTDSVADLQWQKTFGGSGDDCGRSVQQTSDEGYIIAGYTSSFDHGNYDICLIKIDSGGSKEWQKTFGGMGADHGYAVQQTCDNGYIIASMTNSFGTGRWDVYLIKTDSAGNLLWQKTFDRSAWDNCKSVQQTFDRGYIIAGTTCSCRAADPNLCDPNVSSLDPNIWDFNVYLIKTNPDGNDMWQKTFGGSNWDGGFSVQQTIDGGYIISGSTYSFDTRDYDVYLIKTNSAGIMQWEKTLGGSNDEYGYSVRQTIDRGYIIVGETKSFGAGKSDVYLVKLCSDGTLSADFNCNGTVNFEDLDIIVGQWLQPPGVLSADIAPEIEDGIVNFLDFAAFTKEWLQCPNP